MNKKIVFFLYDLSLGGTERVVVRLSNYLVNKDYEVEIFPYSNLQIGYGNNEDDCFNLPDSSPDYGKNIAAYYFWLFPFH